MRRKRRVIQGTSERLMQLLRRSPMSVDELAGAVGLTRSAVRPHLATLLHDGLIEPREVRRGVSKPSQTYGVTALAEQGFSRAYVPMLQQLLSVVERRVDGADLDAIMREVGRGFAAGQRLPGGTLRERVQAAATLLNELGGQTEVEENGRFVIRGSGCPLGEVTPGHPEVCRALESLLTEFVGAPAISCCERAGRPRCCFEISRPLSEDPTPHQS